MRMAITDRAGPDGSPLTIHLLQAEFDQCPPLGDLVCAIGQDDWHYIGPVTSVDEAARTYTITPIAGNRKLDNLKIWHGVS